MTQPTYKSAIAQGKAYRILRQGITEALEDSSTSMPEWTLLSLVNERGTMRLNEVASELGVEAPLVTVLVKQLQAKNLVHVEADATDSRAKIITLTKSAQKLLPSLESSVGTHVEQVFKGVGERDRAVFYRTLERLCENNDRTK